MFERIAHIIAEQLGTIDQEDITIESSLDGFDMDSIDAVEIIMAIEDDFDIEIPDAEAEKFQTITDIMDYLHSVGIEG